MRHSALALAIVASLAAGTSARWVPRAALRVTRQVAVVCAAATASDAPSPALAAELLEAHAALFARLADALGAADAAAVEFALGNGATGSVRGIEATDRRVAWASSRALRSAGACSGALSCWPTPTVEVPALFVRTAYERVEDADGDARGGAGTPVAGSTPAAARGARLVVELDFRPRLDGAWERAAQPPDSRETFSAAALRGEYDAHFFTADVRAWRDGLRALPGAVELAPPAAAVRLSGRRQFGGDDGGAAAGPLALALGLPATAGGAAAAAAAAAEAVELWLGWLARAREASWMRNRLQYTRDCQLRAALYAAAARELGAAHGAAGRALASAEQGRPDMWGHNLLQEQSAFGHDGDDGEGRD